ncbi:MAG: zinc metalloprotease HtpX [Candidatus Micrarchaeota archaeon]|nr:zinc metalloprotease HtpX [Candidatus Micrarchaeota archaeon]
MIKGSPDIQVWISTALVFGLIAGILGVIMLMTGGQISVLTVFFFSLIFLGIQWYLGPIIVRWVSGAREVSVSEAPELHAALERIAKQSGIPKPKLYVVESPIPNAFAFGRGKSDAGIAIHTGLLRRLDKQEVEAVIAHEVGHIKHNDVIIMTIASVIPVLLYYLVVAYMSGRDERPNPIAVFLGAILARLLGQLVVLWLSRQREYYADAHSAYIMKDSMPLARALVKITYDIPKEGANESLSTLYVAEHGAVSTNLISAVSKNDPNAILAAVEKEPDNPLEIISTHPSLKKRIKALFS